jgi:nitroimidazol reductase NimA-like FMN-containing flavoprotein (pyridoxamine 5'-phosphate oxidase superfamily)
MVGGSAQVIPQIANMASETKTPKTTRPEIPGYGLPKSKKGLLPWKWAEERLKKSRQYWIATVRPDQRPHVMVVWALWMNGLLYFSTGAKSRKAENLAKNPHCTMCTENAAEAVIVEGVVETERNREIVRKFVSLYEKKYQWKLGEMGEDLMALNQPLYYLRPKVGFGFWEKKFAPTATRWLFE